MANTPRLTRTLLDQFFNDNAVKFEWFKLDSNGDIVWVAPHVSLEGRTREP